MKPHENESVQQVGYVAGNIYRWLEARNSSGDIDSLRRGLAQFDERTLHQGIGWLMREGKVSLEPKAGEANNVMLRLNRNS
jgi:hypothetical protein